MTGIVEEKIHAKCGESAGFDILKAGEHLSS
jgi:hypothetical protein